MALSADVCHNWSLFALKKEEGKQGHQLTTPLSKVYKNSCSYSAMDILTAINFLNFAQVQKLNLLSVKIPLLVSLFSGQKKIQTLQTNYQNIHGDFGLF